MSRTAGSSLTALQLQRLGTMMEPEPGDPLEVEGVLNPAATRGPDGALYLFPRLVAAGNYSRIGVVRVRFDDAGDPRGVERLGVALEPETDYERSVSGRGGCEDARVTFVAPLGCYVMTYTAFSPRGPRIAIATSVDLVRWRRHGLATFHPFRGIELDTVDNKDASVFPTAILDPSGQPALALLHRPLFAGTRPEEKARAAPSEPCDLDRESIWISYCHEAMSGRSLDRPFCFESHHQLAVPVAAWERLKIGGGPPPILTRRGWLMVYHGVAGAAAATGGALALTYSAGLMILDPVHPRIVAYRSPSPILTPELPIEHVGTMANVVFPTGLDRRDDLGTPDRFDVYYGMADRRVGVARLDLPKGDDWPPTIGAR